MPEYDDTLEIGIAAGLDIPTALTLAHKPKRNNTKLVWLVVILLVILWLIT